MAARRTPHGRTPPGRSAPAGPVAPGTPVARDRAIATALERWFAREARDLPWRQPITLKRPGARAAGATSDPLPRRDPYRALVSEAMLQQTQVSRVVGSFEAFLERFPTAHALAAAEEQAVLAAWAGLGYYRRARQLHAAARAIVDRHGGAVPPDPAALRALPGVGRYTAGAIASMVFGVRTPLVDGNVARVLLRLRGEPMTVGQPATERWAWAQAERLVSVCEDPGVFNEALMELGATRCTPRKPDCPACPLRRHCMAYQRGTTETIPAPRRAADRRTLRAEVLLALVRPPRGASGPCVALQQRPSRGLWAAMWELPTIEHDAPALDPAGAAERFGVGPLNPLEAFTHQTTHRTVVFQPWQPQRSPLSRTGLPKGWVAVEADQLDAYPMSNPQRALVRRLIGAAVPSLGTRTAGRG
jgi:A/G-specific adenine glycosylase